MLWNSKKFNRAMFFAVKAHKNQMMQYPSDMPYVAHIFGVCQTAINYVEKNIELDWDLLVQVALLHDTIEDTDVTYQDIKLNFGENVANGVLAVSKEDNIEKEKQMENCIQKIKRSPKEIAMVKLADRIFNIRERVPTWSKEKQEFYKKEAQYICDNLGYASSGLKQALIDAIDNY